MVVYFIVFVIDPDYYHVVGLFVSASLWMHRDTRGIVGVSLTGSVIAQRAQWGCTVSRDGAGVQRDWVSVCVCVWGGCRQTWVWVCSSTFHMRYSICYILYFIFYILLDIFYILDLGMFIHVNKINQLKHSKLNWYLFNINKWNPNNVNNMTEYLKEW